MPTIGFPLLLIPIAIYNIVVFLMPGAGLTAPLFTLPLLSGVTWGVSFNDLVLALGIILLLFEFARASRPGAKYVMDHILSLVVLGAAGAEFLWLAPFGTSAFALLVLLTFVDFLGGLTLSLRHRAARRAMLRSAGHEAAPAPAPATSPAPVPAAPPPSAPAPVRTEPPPLAPREPPLSHPQMEVITPEVDSPSQHVQPDAAKPGDIGGVVKVEPAHKSVSDWSASDLVRDHDGQETTRPVPPPIVPRRD
ncbi:hypothetical protein AFIC_000361 [[Pseudomonas] carboxydohydrogena]|uniref:Uncharacterized protein n=1 Tax=Afipia carboxydohydrogena TaxID=290 RepID=A0ABY8BSH2_AFICR|nr:hypothetical protein [[Pseudomonas] carboxydohydrogena]WEF51906.1 hypothetical protein AFIC_000361 [[Pseudomonas] carboxydohydrogena]